MMDLYAFQLESNMIEGIPGASAAECEALSRFIGRPSITIQDLMDYVNVIQPNAVLRDKDGLNVSVGTYRPPHGGPDIVTKLRTLLVFVNDEVAHNKRPWHLHCEYEDLHPFTDGNGRSGRALWLWMHGGNAPLGFLHTFYYETLKYRRVG